MMEEDILHEVMRMAQAEGCNDVKIVLSEKTADDITVLSGKVDKMQHATIRSLSLNLFIDGRDGYFYTNRVSLQGMRDFIRKAVEATRMLESDIAQTLPDPARYYRGPPYCRSFAACCDTAGKDPSGIGLQPGNRRQTSSSYQCGYTLQRPLQQAVVSREQWL